MLLLSKTEKQTTFPIKTLKHFIANDRTTT